MILAKYLSFKDMKNIQPLLQSLEQNVLKIKTQVIAGKVMNVVQF